MTDKQKSQEIANDVYIDWNDSTLATGAEYGAMKMAEWKDATIKKYLQHGKEFALEKGNHELAELFEIIIEDLKL